MPEANADMAANQVKIAWWTRNILSNKITVDKYEELLEGFKNMMSNDYGSTCNFISSRNLWATTIVERVHQTMGTVLHYFKI